MTPTEKAKVTVLVTRPISLEKLKKYASILKAVGLFEGGSHKAFVKWCGIPVGPSNRRGMMVDRRDQSVVGAVRFLIDLYREVD